MSAPGPEVVKWYTRARKFPQLIGRTPDGAKIPGGPYTFTQAVGAGLVLLAGVNTTGLWAHYGLVGNAVLLLGAAYGAVLGLGRIPVGSRNPIAVAAGVVHAVTAPRAGRLAGRPVRLRRPRRVRHRVTVLLTEPPPPMDEPSAVAAAAPAHVDRSPVIPPQPAAALAAHRTGRVARRQPALSGVQALLAQGAAAPPARVASLEEA